VHTIATTTHGRYLVAVPSGPGPWPLLVGFHGYAENAERHLEQLRSIPGAERWRLVAIQGLHRVYNTKTQEVVAGWMTREDRDLAIADNVAYVDAVLEAVRHAHPWRPTLAFLGYSQGVAMAYRAAALGLHPADAILALGGDVPPELTAIPNRPRALIARGDRDEWYAADKLQADLARLRAWGLPLETCLFPGGHEWSEEFRAAAGRLLAAVAGP
jgi:predicted esterase